MAAGGDERKKVQIYASVATTSGRQVTSYWRDKYEKDAKKYWDIFYKRHQDKFFKDRHYLDKEWGAYFQSEEGKKLMVLEVGCGAGNTIFPLISTYPHIYVHACDFSPRAIDLVKAHKDYRQDRVNAFVCDLTVDDLCEKIPSSSVDVVTMVFMLSAVSPEKMPLVVQNVRKVLKPNGRVLLRDYATGDLAQERLTSKEQQISENFYVRGDGTRAFYFPNDFLMSLFAINGFSTIDIGICQKQVENRSLELVMNRRWVQSVFAVIGEIPKSVGDSIKAVNLVEEVTDSELDISDTVTEMFAVSPSLDAVTEIISGDLSFTVKGLAREYQHTCLSTGLMLWESARVMCKVLAHNRSIVAGKKVLELGCGSAGVCSMVAAIQSAELVVATDGDTAALDLLKENVASNLQPGLIHNLVIKRLIWGNKEDITAVRDLSLSEGRCGFDIIIGTDVTYIHDAVTPLLETARELMSDRTDGEVKAEAEPALILCHIQRRVTEDSIIAIANQCGFRLTDRLVNGTYSGNGIISSWFGCVGMPQDATFNIMYFRVQRKV